MCGIAGWVTSAGQWDRAVLERMADAIRHRGPDGDGYFIGGTERAQVALAHRRLSIIDLAGGAQPMHSADGRHVIVFNGEIYNFKELRTELAAAGHRFDTASDTEVLLAAYREWGERAVERLRGMFAFAVWDETRKSLFLARDRFGKKPLYLMPLEGGVAFASEIKALLTLPGIERAIDRVALSHYLVFRYVPGPRTFFDRIGKLDPGCFAIVENGTMRTERYYTPPEQTASFDRMSDRDAIGEFRRLLEESVKLRLVSDVPFGAFLSGGVDSSAIVALMSRNLTQKVRTFSIGFTEPDPGELPYARNVARHFGTEHHEVIIRPDDIMDNLDATIDALDAPVSEPATVPLLLLSRAASQHVKMVLSGEGADEFLGGYAKHSIERFATAYQGLPAILRGALTRTVGALPRRRFNRLAHVLDTLSEEDRHLRFPLWFGAFDRTELRRIVRDNDIDLSMIRTDCANNNPPLRGLMLFDQTSWLPDNLLERGDRVTMAASIEARMPFMDHELAAFTARLPPRLRIRGWTGKWLLRQAMKDILPREIFGRRKRGFPVPLAAWFRGPMRQMLADTLLSSRSLSAGLIGRANLERMLKAHVDGSVDATKPIWMLMNLDRFTSRYGLSV